MSIACMSASMRGMSAPLAGEGLSGAMIEEMMAATERESGDRAGRVRALFERFTEPSAGVSLADSAETALKHDGPTLSFESIAGREEDVVAQRSRLYDMAVVPHPRPTRMSPRRTRCMPCCSTADGRC